MPKSARVCLLICSFCCLMTWSGMSAKSDMKDIFWSGGCCTHEEPNFWSQLPRPRRSLFPISSYRVVGKTHGSPPGISVLSRLFSPRCSNLFWDRHLLAAKCGAFF
jgi:hypothetical protein